MTGSSQRSRTKCEDVRHNVAEGHFVRWQETGLYINLAIAIGSYRGLGYGQSVGAMIMDDGACYPRLCPIGTGCDGYIPSVWNGRLP
jgi:hypothetical protein